MHRNSSIISGIYTITCLVDDKVYVGSASNVIKRWCNHRHDLNSGKHHSKHLQRAWTKYGDDSFAFRVVEYVNGSEMLLVREQWWIDKTKSFDREFGFNMVQIAGSNTGMKWSEETRSKIMAKRIGRRFSDSHRIHIGDAHRGSKSHRAKLNEGVVLAIKLRLNASDSDRKLANEFRVSTNTISKIRNCKTWSHVAPGMKIDLPSTKGDKHHNSKLTEVSVREIKAFLAREFSVIQIAKLYGVARTTVSDVKFGRTWGHVD